MITLADISNRRYMSFAPVVLLGVWFAGVAYSTWPSFAWQIEYFKRPGESYYRAVLAAILLLSFGCAIYARFRTAKFARWEPVLLAVPAVLVIARHPWGGLSALLLAGGFYAVGRSVLRALKLDLDEWVSAAAIGLSLTAWVLAALGAGGVLSRVLLLVVAVVLGSSGLPYWPRAARAVRAFARRWPEETEVSGPLVALLVPFLFLLGLSAAMVISAPPVAHDAVNFHLPLAKTWTEAGSLTPSLRNPYSFFPQVYELLMALALAVGGEAAAHALTGLIAVVGLAAVWRACRMAGGGFGASAASLALLGSVPAIHWSASVIKNDFLMVSLQAAAVVCLFRGRMSGDFRWFLVAAWLVGSSFGAKHSALFGAVGLCWIFFVACWRSRHRFAAAAALGLVLLATASPWHLRTYLEAGRITFPADASVATRIVYSNSRPTLASRLGRIPSTIHAAHIDGEDRVFENVLRSPVGLLMTLLVALPLLLRRGEWSEESRLLAISGALVLGYWIMSTSKIRYAAAGLTFLAPVIAIALERVFRTGSAGLRGLVSTAVIYGLVFGWTGVLIIENSGPQALHVAGLISRDEYVQTVYRSAPALEALGDIAGPEDDIFVANCCAPHYYRYSSKLDCRLTTAPAAKWSELGQHGPPEYEYLVRARWFSPARLGIPEDSEIVYQDRACAIHRLSPPWTPGAADSNR